MARPGRGGNCLHRGLAEPGDYVTCELAGQPVAVLRDRQGGLRALSNVCLHRMSTLLEGRGNTGVITCPYHGWSYSPDGSLRGAPAMQRNEGFCKDSYRLPEIACEEWLGWVFVSLHPVGPGQVRIGFGGRGPALPPGQSVWEGGAIGFR